jgi:hypothetical protein
VLAQPTRPAVYGPVRTVVWQRSAGDRSPYASQTPFPVNALLGKRAASKRRGLELQQTFRIAVRDLRHFFLADRQGVQKGSPLGVGAEWVIHREKDLVGAGDL